MSITSLGQGNTWQDKVIEADKIWAQVKGLLAANGVSLPQVPRRPDVRLIVDNVSGAEVRFHNPGDHSGSKEEIIPATGDKKAVMVMLNGGELEDQKKNADRIYRRFQLGEKGLSEEFVTALRDGALSAEVQEAYGPAPFTAQAEKLVDLNWLDADGGSSIIIPEKGLHAAFGARAAANESAFLAQFPIYVKGTGTTPELVESDGIVIAISQDWQTGAETTRPIVPSISSQFYGAHFANMACVTVDSDSIVHSIDLKNGTVFTADPGGAASPANKPPAPGGTAP